MYEWLLVLHVLSAFALVSGVVAFWGLTLAARRGTGAALAPLGQPFGALTGLGGVLVLVFGIWLALYLDEHEIWDWWILGSIALWAVGMGVGRQSGEAMIRASAGGPDAAAHRRRGVALQALSTVAILGVLALMIFKPGA